MILLIFLYIFILVITYSQIQLSGFVFEDSLGKKCVYEERGVELHENISQGKYYAVLTTLLQWRI